MTLVDEKGNEIPNPGPPSFFPYVWPFLWEKKISPMKTGRLLG